MVKRRKTFSWRSFSKRSLSALLSFALVVTLGSGVGIVVKQPMKVQADTTNLPFKTTLTGSDTYATTKAINPQSNMTWRDVCVVAKTSQRVENVVISGTVFLEIRQGVTLTCVGDNAVGSSSGGRPGIELTSGAKLIVLGEGTLIARGGNAADGSSGSSGSSPYASGDYIHSGSGGSGGAGGAGAGAGIGTRGGTGGSGGSGGSGTSKKCDRHNDGYSSGGSGGSGSSGGSVTTSMGELYVLGSVTVRAQGGSGGYGGSGGSNNESREEIKRDCGKFYHDRHGYGVGGAGGGGGGGGTAGAGIGIGGAGGAGGGGGGGGAVYKNDGGCTWSNLPASGGSGGRGYRNGNSGGGNGSSYGGSGGSGGSVGSVTGSTKTVLRNNLASVSGSGYGGREASVSSRTKLTYKTTINVQMLDKKEGVVDSTGWNNIYKYSKNQTTFSTVRLGYSTFDTITNVNNDDIYKPGYTFEGWFSESGELVIDEKGRVVQNVKDYTCGGAYNSVSSPLYAHWKRDVYQLNLDANGGGFPGNRKSIPKESYTGETLKDLTSDPVPTRTGYFLLGYNTKKDGTGDWIYGTNNVGTRDTGQIVTGMWNKILEERKNESDERLTDAQVIHQNQTSATTFLNTWTTNKQIWEGNSGSKKMSSYLSLSGVSGQKLQGIYPYENDTTIYAQWAPIHYTLRYFSEDSSSEAKWLGDEYNVPYFNVFYKSLEDFKVTRKHYEFKGWNVYASQDWGMYEPNRLYRTSLTEEDGDIVSLYAAWRMTDSYTISYNGNGGAGVPVNGYTFKDSMDTDEDVYKISSKIPTRENYTFTGWNTEIDGSGDTWVEGTKVVGLEENLTLYAQWKLNPSLTYHANGGSFSVAPEKEHIAVGKTFRTLSGDALPSREGYHFVKWSLSATDTSQTYEADKEVSMPDKNLVLYAVWEKDGYGVSSTVYNDNPENSKTIPKYFSLQLKETKEDGTVVGYPEFEENNKYGTGSISGDTVVSTEYTAKKTDGSEFKVKYRDDVTFRVEVPSYVDTSDMMVYANGSVLINKKKEEKRDQLTSNITAYYYYYTISNATAGQEIMVTGLKYKTYTLDFQTNGGTIPESIALGSYTYGTKTTLPEPEKTGYTFGGWYTDEACTSTKVTEIAANEEGDKTFYAKWTPNTYTIVFDGNVYEGHETTVDGKTEITYTPTGSGGVTGEHKTEYTQNITYDESTRLSALAFKYHTDIADYVKASSPKDYDNYDGDTAGKEVVFLGWSTQQGAETPTYTADARVRNLCSDANGTVKLYAVWKVSNCKLTYNGNGGKVKQTVSTVKKDGEGNTVMQDGVPVLEENEQMVSSYAVEKQKGAKVTLNFDDVKRTGYTFLGWATLPNAAQPDYYTNATYPDAGNESTEIAGGDFTADKVLYAVWKENQYTITFDANGGKQHVVQESEGDIKQSTIQVTGMANADAAPVYYYYHEATDTYYYYCKVNDLYYPLTDWKQYATPRSVSVMITATPAGDLEPVKYYRSVTDSVHNYPILKYQDGDVTRYLCAKTELTDDTYLYVMDSPTDGTDVSTVTQQFEKDGNLVKYSDIKDDASLIYDYSDDLDHTGHDDASKFRQTLGYAQSGALNKNAGNSIFDIKSGGTGVTAFETEKQVGEGINSFTGFYKPNADTPEKFDYFLGWSLDENASEPDYLPHESVEKLATGAAGDDSVALNAIWSATPKVYTMFSANGGEFATTESATTYKTLRDMVTGGGTYTIQEGLLPNALEDGVSVSVKDGSVCAAGTEGSAVYTLSKKGYDFAGWTTDPSLTGDALTANVETTMETLRNGLSVDSFKGQTYYAVWTPKSVTVTFYGNGANEEAPVQQTISYDKEVKLDANAFTKTGYNFVKWATEVYDGTPIGNVGYTDEAQIYISSSDESTYRDGLKLYAVWEEKPSHNLIYDDNGGYGGPGIVGIIEDVEGRIYISEQYEEETDDAGQPVARLSVSMPKRDGYKFAGWSTQANAQEPDSGYEYQESTSKEESDAITYPTWTPAIDSGSKTLYAVWKNIPENAVVYQMDNTAGSGTFRSRNYREGEEFNLYFSRTPSKEGYDFEGWSEDMEPDEASGSVIYRSGDGQTFTMPDEEVNFYPVWKAHTYKITYKTSNDSNAECTVDNIAYDKKYVLCGLEEKTAETEDDYDITADDLISKLFANTDVEQEKAQKFMPKAGYKFIGWSTTPSGKVNYKPGQPISKLSALDEAEIILYAVYEPQKTVYTLVNELTVSEYDENLNQTTENKTLDPLTIGDNMPILDEVPTKYGYSFGGYFTEEGGQGEQYYTKDLTNVAEHTVNTSAVDVKLYAYWIPDSYTLYYEYNGEKVASQEVKYGEEITTLSKQEIIGLTLDDDMVLAGWGLEKDGDVKFNPNGTNVGVCHDEGLYNKGLNIVLYASVGKATKSTVTYNPNGGSNEPVDDHRYTTGQLVTVNFSKIPKKNGYTFKGWATSSGAEEPKYYQTESGGKTTFTITSDVVLYAVWEANSYSITYIENYAKDNERSENSVTDNLKYDTEGYHFRGAETFTRTGYSLSGWAITAETGVTYVLNQELTTALTGAADGNVKLYAVWTANTYKVSYDANQPANVDGTVKGSMKDSKMTYDEDGTLRTNAYSLTGYKFMGWSTTPDGAVEYKDSEEVKNISEKEDVVLYAVWKSRAELTGDDEDIDWSEKTLTAIISNTYSLTVTAGQKPKLDDLTITAIYADGTCRAVKDYTTNLDSLETTEDTYIEIVYEENSVSKMLQIPIRIKGGTTSSSGTNNSTSNSTSNSSSNTSNTNNTNNSSSTVVSATTVVEKALNATNTDKYDLAGSSYAKLQLKATSKSRKKQVGLKWKSVRGATSYMVYGAKCKGKMKKLKTVPAKSGKKSYAYTIKKTTAKKYYKYLVVACKKTTTNIKAGKNTVKATTDNVVTISKTVYATSKDKSYGNPSKLKAKSKLTMKKGKSKKIKVKVKKTKKKLKKYGKSLRYESLNPKIAKVSKTGKVKGVKPGKTYIYVYAQNGVGKKIKITVKK